MRCSKFFLLSIEFKSLSLFFTLSFVLDNKNSRNKFKFDLKIESWKPIESTGGQMKPIQIFPADKKKPPRRPEQDVNFLKLVVGELEAIKSLKLSSRPWLSKTIGKLQHEYYMLPSDNDNEKEFRILQLNQNGTLLMHSSIIMQRIYVQSTLVQAIASPSKREIALLLQVPASPPVQEHFRIVVVNIVTMEAVSSIVLFSQSQELPIIKWIPIWEPSATDYIAVISSSAATLSLFSVSSGALVFHQPILGHWKGLPKKISIGSAEISPWSPCGVCIFLADAENARVWIAALEFRGSEEERLQIHQLQARDSQFKRFAVYPVNSRIRTTQWDLQALNARREIECIVLDIIESIVEHQVIGNSG